MLHTAHINVLLVVPSLETHLFTSFFTVANFVNLVVDNICLKLSVTSDSIFRSGMLPYMEILVDCVGNIFLYP